MRFFPALLVCSLLMLVPACFEQAPARHSGVFENADVELTEGELNSLLRGNTIIEYSRQHGTQVEYLAPDGRAFLWYPGNQKVVVGQWEADAIYAQTDLAAICFRYGANTFNPVTGRAGGHRQCQPSDRYLPQIEELLKGNPFFLASGAPPFVLDTKPYRSIQLAKRAGLATPVSAVESN